MWTMCVFSSLWAMCFLNLWTMSVGFVMLVDYVSVFCFCFFTCGL